MPGSATKEIRGPSESQRNPTKIVPSLVEPF